MFINDLMYAACGSCAMLNIRTLRRLAFHFCCIALLCHWVRMSFGALYKRLSMTQTGVFGLLQSKE